MAETYPRKYWWLVAVALPILLALIAIFPSLRKSGSKSEEAKPPTLSQQGNGNIAQTGGVNILDSDLSNKTFITNLSVVEKEYLALKGEPLTDDKLRAEIDRAISLLKSSEPAKSVPLLEQLTKKIPLPALQNDLGVAYARSGDLSAATDAYEKALQTDPANEAANLNLGLAKASRGELKDALPHLEKASASGEGQRVMAAVERELQKDVHEHEIEPNNDGFHPNAIPLRQEIAGQVADNSDADFFRFTTPPKYRDIIEVQVKNRSQTLAPALTLFDANRSRLDSSSNGTTGANLVYSFSTAPEMTYQLQISGAGAYGGSNGAYGLIVTPLQKYDSFEPNDDILHPSDLLLGGKAEADIMDIRDADFFRVKSSVEPGIMKVALVNRSTTLAPEIDVYDANKSHLDQKSNGTTGANLDYSLQVQANAVYYIEISGRGAYGSSSGAYTLSVTQPSSRSPGLVPVRM